MRVVIDVAGTSHEVEVAQAADSATLADLVRASSGLEVSADDTLWVDEAQHLGSDRVREVTLLEGSRIAKSRPQVPAAVTGWTATLSGGLHAGLVVPVPGNRPLVIGRSPQADITVDSPSVSWSHAAVEREGDGVRVEDTGSSNGTYIGGQKLEDVEGLLVDEATVIVAGGIAITLRPDSDEVLAPAPGSLHNLTASHTAPFNRPPRPGRPPAPEPVVPPSRKDEPPPARFSAATILAPLVLAFGMVLMMGDARYAMMALLSPVIGIATWAEQKRRRKADIKDEDERFTKVLEDFQENLDDAARAERTRRGDDAPDPATVIRRAALPTTRLWQRRKKADDFLMLHAGIGDVPWRPPLDKNAGSKLDDEVKEILDNYRLTAAPVEVDLTDAGVVGIVGDREGALAVARSLLCQAAVHCGPADLTIGVFCDSGRKDDWSFATWLPHVRRIGDGSGGQWVSAHRDRSDSMLRGLRDSVEAHPTPGILLVLDSDVLTEGRDAPARALLGHGRPVSTGLLAQEPPTQVSGIVIAATEEALPASCTTVLTVRDDAAGTATRPDDLTKVDDVILAGIDLDTARECAHDLARFDDPELSVPGAALPSLVRMPPLLNITDVSADEISKMWNSATRITTPVGMSEGGVYELDLVRDGPHGLVGGTTGSGKSEFLRSFVAGLAARNDPTRLTFILIDFKGGAAFKTCERLPHTIGTVSNLDEQLADRALRALEAELRYRQRMFATAGEGVDNIDAYWATNPAEPMPRLCLVIDEFAMLAKDYPDVLSSLVSVAAVGRTLGVHMILATQRPAGVVNEDILANTNLRVALRVQSRDDSINVVGVPAAASIGRTQWGRAFIKLGQDDISPVQTALVTGQSETETDTLVDVHPVLFGEEVQRATSTVDKDAPTDLDLLIDAIVGANDGAGIGAPRKVWPEPLGARVPLAATRQDEVEPWRDDTGEPLPFVGDVNHSQVSFALADDPDRQRQLRVGWDISRGNILVLGIPGSGTSTTLSTIALTMAAELSPDDLDVFVLDLGSRDLASLAQLPHTAAYVGSGSSAREQQVRFLKFLRSELDRRKAEPGPHRKALVLIDGLGVLKDEYDDFEGLKLLDGLYRAYADGPDVGMHFAVTTSRSKAIPSAIDEVTTQKWLFHLADPYDYSAAGVKPKDAPPAIAGRCVLGETKLQAHVATPMQPLAGAVALVSERWAGAQPKQTVVGQLPGSLTVDELGVVAQVASEPWRIPVGIRESDLAPGWVEVYEGEHIMVAGPARSGKSSTLLSMAATIRGGAAADGVDNLDIWGVCGRRSPLATATSLDKVVVGTDGLAALLASARVHRGPLVLLIDDAETFDDADQSIAGLITARPSDLLIIAAGRSDDLRALYSHWTKTVRKSRAGVILQPNIDFDGDLLQVTLPRRAPVALTPGRGYVSSGGALELVQLASVEQTPAG